MALSVTVRMYRLHELGDCFLLSVRDGANTSRALIDCGSFRNGGPSKARLAEIVADITAELGGAPLNVLVGTHQHNDHVSGFVHCEPELRALATEQVWLSWLDDPRDRMAKDIGVAHKNLALSLQEARMRLHATNGSRPRALRILDDILGFYGASAAGAAPELPAKAIEIAKGLGKSKPRYLEPGDVMDLPGLSPGSARVYVLGPPRESDLLYRKDPRTGESYDHALAAANLSATRFLDAVNAQRGVTSSAEAQYPFSDKYKKRNGTDASPALKALIKTYSVGTAGWRKIDEDWLNQAESLALYLDSYTNNSSLVLAFEAIDSGKVFLFAADAQTGNWLSWSDIKWKGGTTTDDLLARTVLYKVGHHGSHNATLVATLEKMNNPDLAALIPVHKKDPNIVKERGWKMPARNLFNQLVERTSHRVLQMDGANPPRCNPSKEPAAAAWKRIGVKPKVTPLYIELTYSL